MAPLFRIVWKIALALLACGDVRAIGITLGGADFDVNWNVQFDANNNACAGGCFDYRYTITHTAGAGKPVLDWFVGGGHFPLHDERNVLSPGNTTIYQPDGVVPFPHPNYDWFNFDLPNVGDALTFGFDDPHGPTAGTGRLERDGIVPEAPDLAFVPVPGFPIGSVNNGVFGANGLPQREYTVLGWAARDAGGGLTQYMYFLQNTGTAAISPAAGNHADFFVNEVPAHIPFQDEAFNLDSNRAITGMNNGHLLELLPPGVSPFNVHWFDLGTPAWQPNEVLTLGFTDVHKPGRTNGGGDIIGSEGEAFFPGEPAPSVNGSFFVPEPPTAALVAVTLSLLGLQGARRTLRKAA